MKPLVCPQCGAKITEFDMHALVVECAYCETNFIVEDVRKKEERQPPAPPAVDFTTFDYDAAKRNAENGALMAKIGTVIGVAVVIGCILLAVQVRRKPAVAEPRYTLAPTPYKSATPLPPAAKYDNLLDFGGKGVGEGLFTDATAIAVDAKGHIYVGDSTLRVQEFDEKGQFVRVVQVPRSNKFYKKAGEIQKLAVDRNGRLFVLVGGTVQIWGPKTIELPDMTYEAAPDPIVDFALRADGGLLLVAVDGETDTLIFVAKNGRVMKRIEGFVTDAADDITISPAETGLAAIRLAVDGAGNIFSTYALSDLGSYQVSTSTSDYPVFRFTPEGKLVDRFSLVPDTVGIAADNGGRVYVSRGNTVEATTPNGSFFGVASGFNRVDAFTVDSDNNLSVLSDDRVIKRAPLQ